MNTEQEVCIRKKVKDSIYKACPKSSLFGYADYTPVFLYEQQVIFGDKVVLISYGTHNTEIYWMALR